jgi:1-phosphofructokinase
VDNLKIDDIIRIKQKKINAGGKTFNTAKFLSNCGVNVLAIGIIAGNNGRRFSNLLKNSKISHPMLLELPGETRENYNFFLKMDRY